MFINFNINILSFNFYLLILLFEFIGIVRKLGYFETVFKPARG